MKNVRKRISALVLALCLVMSTMVPAVWAEETEPKEYNFDYIGQTGGTTNLNAIETGGTANASVIGNITEARSNGVINWNYHSHSQQLASASNKVGGAIIVQKGFTVKGDDLTKMGYFRMVANTEGDYIAFNIENPGVGIERHIEVQLATHKYGVEICNVYLLSAAETTDVGAAIASSEPVGTVSFWNTVHGRNADFSKAEASVVSVGNWTPEKEGDYILVFEAVKLSRTAINDTLTGTTKRWSKMFISKVTMSTDADKIASAKNAEVVLHHSKTDGSTTNGKGNNYTTYTTLSDAISTAASTDRIALVNQAQATSITVPAGVTLDLNGKELKADSVTAIAADAEVVDSVGGGILTVAQKGFEGNGDNGGYLPLYNSTGYRFYHADVNADTSAESGKLKFQVKFDKNAGYDVLAVKTSGAVIGGSFTWTANGGDAQTQAHDISYADGTTLAQKWGQVVQENNYANGWIVLTFKGLDAFDALSVAPYIESDTGVKIQIDAQSLKSAA